MASDIICPRCGQPVSGLYESKAGFLCFSCLDKEDSTIVDRYDGWRDRETLKVRRADIARKNFCTAPPRIPSRRFKRGASNHHSPLPFAEGGLHVG